MRLEDLKNKLVAVLGFGVEGQAVTRYLIKHGIKPVLFDQKSWEKWPEQEQKAIRNLQVNFIFGPDAFLELAGFDIAFRSPGVRLSQLTSNKLQVTSQTKFFFENSSAKTIGVTGTKGKGTTSALIYEMLKANSKLETRNSKTYLTGNIGKVQPLDIIDGLKPEDWVVYELSSFQLQDLNQSPHIGVVLMVTSDHLDYHKDEKEYVDAKSAITKFQTGNDFAVINADFENSSLIGELGKGEKLYFSLKNYFVDFDSRQNQQSKKFADAFLKNGEIVTSDFHLPVSDIQLRGRHNLENLMAAALAARCAGAGNEAIAQAVSDFKGLEHRLEFAAEKKGIKFYNDSFSTTPETAVAAIKSFEEPLILILGGSQKHSDFTELGKTISNGKNIKAVILIGEEAGKIKSTMNFKGKILEGAKSMAEIFTQIKSMAQKGDVVLLSPACASFDMFKSYIDRGEQFKQEVKQW